jgi:hypothetical protein
MEKYCLVPGDGHRTEGAITCRRWGGNERQKQYWEDDPQGLLKLSTASMNCDITDRRRFAIGAGAGCMAPKAFAGE